MKRCVVYSLCCPRWFRRLRREREWWTASTRTFLRSARMTLRSSGSKGIMMDLLSALWITHVSFTCWESWDCAWDATSTSRQHRFSVPSVSRAGACLLCGSAAKRMAVWVRWTWRVFSASMEKRVREEWPFPERARHGVCIQRGFLSIRACITCRLLQ